MNNNMIYVPMASYLAQWFIYKYGGEQPVRLRKGSIEMSLIERAMTLPPEGYVAEKQQEGELAIVLPYSKIADPRTRWYVSPRAKATLVSIIKNDFEIDLWQFLHVFANLTKLQKDLVLLYMERRGITETGTESDAITKIYQRLRKRMQTEESNKRRKKMRTSQK